MNHVFWEHLCKGGSKIAVEIEISKLFNSQNIINASWEEKDK